MQRLSTSRSSAFSTTRKTLTLIAVLLAGVPLLSTAQTEPQTTYRWIDPVSGITVISDMPPPPGIKKVEVSRGGGFSEELDRDKTPAAPGSPSPSAAVRQAAARYPVTLYSSVNCGGPCQLGRDLLNNRGVPFTEKLLQTAEEVDAFKKATSSENPSLPTVLVGKEALRGFEAGAWNSMLDMAGYPKTAPYGSKPSPLPIVTPAAPEKPAPRQPANARPAQPPDPNAPVSQVIQ
ncbi:MAG: glutaredoxin family protein [Betaproteobacteria bacterium]|nr:glutaredoxin family protein [Betaproteobacteria bacterium]